MTEEATPATVRPNDPLGHAAEPARLAAYLKTYPRSDGIDAAVRLIESQAAEIRSLLRWKSSSAPRIESLEGLLQTAQHEAHAGREAIATLASERAANAMLTDELVVAVTAERTRIAEAMRGMVQLMQLPEDAQYPGDQRHIERRLLLSLADATVADSWPNA